MLGRRSVILALLAFGLAGCGAGNERLASVADRTITQRQVDRLVEHGREEAAREGNDFPARGSDGYRELQREALAILVARAQIVEAAQRLGVTVGQAELDRYVRAPHKEFVEVLYEGARRNLGVAEEKEKGDAAKLLGDALRVQLTLEKVRQRVGSAQLQSWVAKARALPVDYANGWEPGA
jgi:hypothetical protein